MVNYYDIVSKELKKYFIFDYLDHEWESRKTKMRGYRFLVNSRTWHSIRETLVSVSENRPVIWVLNINFLIIIKKKKKKKNNRRKRLFFRFSNWKNTFTKWMSLKRDSFIKLTRGTSDDYAQIISTNNSILINNFLIKLKISKEFSNTFKITIESL